VPPWKNTKEMLGWECLHCLSQKVLLIWCLELTWSVDGHHAYTRPLDLLCVSHRTAFKGEHLLWWLPGLGSFEVHWT
jgi:hypothetical protein